MRLFRLIRTTLVATALLASACDSGPVQPSSAVATVTIDPPSATVDRGDSLQLTATPRDPQGNPLTGRQVFWSVRDSSIARVLPDGMIEGRAPGTVEVAASVDGQPGFATITVRSRAVVRVEVQPASRTLASLGDTVQFTAMAYDDQGDALSGKPISWESSAPGVAGITTSGVATAVQNGVTTITARVEGVAGTASLSVTQRVASMNIVPSTATIENGDTLRLVASAVDERGNPLPPGSFSWASSSPSVVSVDTTGLARGAGVGSATITATRDGFSASASLEVRASPVASITVAPAEATLVSGGSVQLSATLVDSRGRPVTGRPVDWTSSDPRIASVGGTGIVVGGAPGAATITASGGGRSGTARITVRAAPIATVQINPASATLTKGDSLQMQTILLDADGRTLTGRSVSWKSSDTGVATVSSAGLLIARDKVGSTTITATAEGRSATAEVRVVTVPVASVTIASFPQQLEVGESSLLRATTRDARGDVLTDRVVRWKSSAPAVASVDPNSGLLTAVSEGAAVITATSEGRQATAQTTIVRAAVASVVVSPASRTLAPGATVQLSATVRDRRGAALTDRAVSWDSDDDNIATVDDDGVVTAMRTGTTSIRAAVEGVSGSATITVGQAPVASVQLQPQSATLTRGDTLRLSAIVRDAAGGALADRSVEWTTSNPAVISFETVNSTTVRLTAGTPGTAVIVATSEGQEDRAVITVSEPAVATVGVTPAEASVTAGESVQLSATVRDSGGDVLSGRDIRWTSGDVAIATVNEAGLVQGKAPGTVTITAVAEGRSGTARVTVRAVPVASVEIAPASATLAKRDTLRLNLTVRDAAGRVLTGRPVEWKSSDETVATVNSDGVVIAGNKTASATISATVEGVSGTAAIEVVPAPIASVTISSPPSALQVGESVQLEAVPRDARGNNLPDRVVRWASNAPSVATINETSGRLTGEAPGTVVVSASSEGKTGTARIDVTAPGVASVEVSPGNATIQEDGSVQLTAVARDTRGTALSGRKIDWSSSDDRVAKVNNEGLVRGAREGTATITASSGERSGTARVVVENVPVASVEVEPDDLALLEGASAQLRATVRDVEGRVFKDRPVDWTSSDPAVATVDADGTVVGRTAGTAAIRAEAEGVRGSAAVVVSAPAPPVQAPARLEKVSGDGQKIKGNNKELEDPLVVRVLDASGEPVAGVQVQWSTDDGSVSPESSVTNDQGRAATRWKLSVKGKGAGQARARVDGLPAVEFTARRK